MSLKFEFRGLSLASFLEKIEELGAIWMVKRLSGNDTGLTGSHQAGPLIPKNFIKLAVPEINNKRVVNPEVIFEECYFPREDLNIEGLRAVYYNCKHINSAGSVGTRDEFRVTRWGGSSIPVQNIENTGSLLLFAVIRNGGLPSVVVWVSSNIEEEDTIEAWLGREVEPGSIEMSAGVGIFSQSKLQVPKEWYSEFPSGLEIFKLVRTLTERDQRRLSADKLLIKRRELEFKIFGDVEAVHVMPRIKEGFSSVEEFIKFSHSVSNRRKSRTGTSLELHLADIFTCQGVKFSAQAVTENHKKPDFLFPSTECYRDPQFPAIKLHMLAAKTCCKDRWRQVLNEANRVEEKHLFTLQEGISSNQLAEMREHHVTLVIPEPNRKQFPGPDRAALLSLHGFIAKMKAEQGVA